MKEMETDASFSPVGLLSLMVGIWWSGYCIANVALTMLSMENKSTTSQAPNLWWVELAVLQNTLGCVATTLFAILTGKSIRLLAGVLNYKILIASLCHLVGTLAINATFVSSKSVISLILTTCQPLFTFLLTTRSVSFLEFSKLLSVVVVVSGMAALQMRHTVLFDIWGVTTATTLSMAFAGRNVLLKDHNERRESTIGKLAAVFSLSAVFSLPLWCLKVVVTGAVNTNVLGVKGVLLSTVHPSYTYISLMLLQSVTPVTHAIVTICIRLFSNIDNFVHISLSWNTIFGVIILAIGIYLYCHTEKTWIVLKLIILFATCLLLVRNVKPVVDIHGETISTAWLYDQPITKNVLANIESLAHDNPTMKISVYCGTTQCVQEVTALEKDNVAVCFAVISDIVKGTPLERWVANHPINKLLAGPEFETHLHEVAILGILWQHGGYYINPMVWVANGSLPACSYATVSKERTVPKGNLSSILDVMYFLKYHPLLKQLTEEYDIKYPKINDTSPFQFDFTKMVWKAVHDKYAWLYKVFDNRRLEVLPTREHHYEVLSHSIPGHLTAIPGNYVDDEMENFAILQYFPFISGRAERGRLQSLSSKGNVTIFFNGRWKMSDGKLVPQLKHLHPVMLSVILENAESWSTEVWSEFQSYLRAHEPIGCYDADLRKHLIAKGVKAFSPSSLMLLMSKPNSGLHEKSHIYATDVREEFLNLLPTTIQTQVVVLQNNETRASIPRAAYHLLEKFVSAKLVITQNVQHALACAAMETPVILISLQSHFTDAMSSVVHMVSVHNMSKHQVKEKLDSFSWETVPHNPNPASLMALRATSWNVIRRDRHLYDSAMKFGVVPMSPPMSLRHEKKLVFFLIFSTSKRSSLHISALTYVSGRFNWRHWRSIESIFHHHPTAEVNVYSNTLPKNFFDILTETGYSIKVRRYDLEEMLVGTPAQVFRKRLKEARQGPFWYTNVSNLLRMLLLYKYGGFYMDTDVIIVRPLHSLKVNVLGQQDSLAINGALMYFEKENPYIEACIREFVEHYNGRVWGRNGPQLLTRVYNSSSWSNEAVYIVESELFYMYHWTKVNQCFSETAGVHYEARLKDLKTKALAVHLNSKLTGDKGVKQNKSLKDGTICKQLLNVYCVLCDKIH
jgi:hypothetical protein